VAYVYPQTHTNQGRSHKIPSDSLCRVRRRSGYHTGQSTKYFWWWRQALAGKLQWHQRTVRPSNRGRHVHTYSMYMCTNRVVGSMYVCRHRRPSIRNQIFVWPFRMVCERVRWTSFVKRSTPVPTEMRVNE